MSGGGGSFFSKALHTVIGGGLGFLVGGPVGAVVGAGASIAADDQSRKAAHTVADAQKTAQDTINSALVNNPNPVMPTPDDSNVAVARQASVAEQVARRGRASTILTTPSADRLG